jgi:serine/threonine-protein kinase
LRNSHRARRRGSLAVTLLVIAGVLAGLFALFNWVVMPLVVGLGRETTVPSVVGIDRFAAESVLASAGLGIGEVRGSANSTVRPDCVISQSPLAGQRVKLGRRVRLDISTGAGRLKIPHAEGLSLARATALLTQSGLVVAGVESLRITDRPPGQVVATRPPFGTDANEGDQVFIQVACRTGSFPMPSLVGLPAATAQSLATQQGLVVGEVKHAPSDEPAGSVLIQYPEEGMLVRDGDTVALIVAVPQGKK